MGRVVCRAVLIGELVLEKRKKENNIIKDINNTCCAHGELYFFLILSQMGNLIFEHKTVYYLKN